MSGATVYTDDTPNRVHNENAELQWARNNHLVISEDGMWVNTKTGRVLGAASTYLAFQGQGQTQTANLHLGSNYFGLMEDKVAQPKSRFDRIGLRLERERLLKQAQTVTSGTAAAAPATTATSRVASETGVPSNGAYKKRSKGRLLEICHAQVRRMHPLLHAFLFDETRNVNTAEACKREFHRLVRRYKHRDDFRICGEGDLAYALLYLTKDAIYLDRRSENDANTAYPTLRARLAAFVTRHPDALPHPLPKAKQCVLQNKADLFRP